MLSNCISATGLKPEHARPIEVPTIADSAKGVSKTLPGYNFKRPSVTRKTPPTPTSYPIIRIVLSFFISCLSARLIASTMLSFAIRLVPPCVLLLLHMLKQEANRDHALVLLVHQKDFCTVLEEILYELVLFL